MTQRRLYFLVLWLPLLIPLIPGMLWFISWGYLFFIPLALFLTWRARRKPTEALLAHAWKAPFKVALLIGAPLELMCINDWLRYPDGRRTLAALAAASARFPLVWAAIGFGCTAVFVALGCLLRLTVARHWPKDRNEEPNP